MANKRELSEKEIIIDKMYVGSYLEEENHIGHEVINLLRADGDVDENGDGQNYIYINPYGTLEKNHTNIDTILLARNTGTNDTIEILAKAWELTPLAKLKTSRKKDIKRIYEQQIKYIRDNNVKYNNFYLDEIYNGTDENKNIAYFTFKVGKLRRPKRPIYISFCKNPEKEVKNNIEGKIFFINRKNLKENKNNGTIQTLDIAKQSHIMYFKNGKVKCAKNKTYPNKKEKDQSYAFDILTKIINDENLWEEKNTTNNVSEVRQFYKYDKCNFIDLVDKQNAETTYSNLFKYIFKANIELFKKFAKEILEIDNISDNINIEREEGHIDLLITDINNVIVIENKIKSGVNGVQYDINNEEIDSQLLDYYKYINGFKKKKYKNKIEWIEDETLIKKFANKNKYFYIFKPDYNYIDTTKIKSVPEKTYKVVAYSKLYKFFDNYRKEYSNKILYYNEILYAIEKHINNVDNILEIETHKRFVQKIDKI